MSRLIAVLAGFTLAAAVAPPTVWAQRRKGVDFSDEAVEAAIERAAKSLWSQYRPNGSPWPEGQTPPGPGQKLAYDNCNYGGWSALATYALLTAGESHQSPRMKRVLNWLARLDSKGNYTLAVRCQIWEKLPPDLGRKLLAADSGRLLASMYRPTGPPSRDPVQLNRYGAHQYVAEGKPRDGPHDNSNTQFGILGVWAAARARLEIPASYWQYTRQHWLRTQMRDGGWSYMPITSGDTRSWAKQSAGTMTAGAVASLFVAMDNIDAAKFSRCGVRAQDKALERGMAWLEKNFHPDRTVGGQLGKYYYYLYALERVGLASGYKYFGDKDWYKLCATNLINTQRADGSWTGNLVDTSFALIFLARGRNPIMFNRLQYDGDWNNRPRALANLTRWVSRDFERAVNWQIVNTKSPVSEWHDAPILLISGARKPKLSAEDVDKLRRFIHQGGTILSVAECPPTGRFFDAAMRAHYATMFPQYELKLLPADHPIYTIHFPISRPMKVWAVSNGVRVLAYHTTTDLMLPWQKNAYVTKSNAFKLAANISLFVNNHKLGRPRGTTPWPAAKSFAPLRAARVARVKYGGNWNPEPLALERLKLLMGRKWQINLTVSQPVQLADLPSKGGGPALVITGTGRLGLDKAEKAALKAYVEGGGTVIIDAAGGSRAFADSAKAVVEEVFGADALRQLPAFSPVYQAAGMKIESVRYRRGGRDLSDKKPPPRLMAVEVNGRPAVFLSREDLTAGMVGYPSRTVIGYHPDSAAELMRNLLLYAAGGRKPKSGR